MKDNSIVTENMSRENTDHEQINRDKQSSRRRKKGNELKIKTKTTSKVLSFLQFIITEIENIQNKK